jgi:uncharacterized membrane protein YvbJ
MAFCGKCGTQLHDNATFCANCGTSTGVSAQPPASVTPAITHTAIVSSAPASRGFFGSLFDFSFSSFVTGKLIKVLYVLAIIVLAVAAVVLVVAAQSQPSPAPVVSIIVAPIAFLLYVILVRVQLEILIVIFRMSEHMAEIAQQGRR